MGELTHRERSDTLGIHGRAWAGPQTGLITPHHAELLLLRWLMADRFLVRTGLAVLPILLPVAACTSQPRVVDIHATNYAFSAPATLPPGPTSFRLVNDGTVLHEVQLFRFHSGISADSAATLLASGSMPEEAYDTSGAVLITAPGTTAHEQVVIPLGKGEVYALLCEFRDADSLPQHSTMGMWATLRVE